MAAEIRNTSIQDLICLQKLLHILIDLLADYRVQIVCYLGSENIFELICYGLSHFHATEWLTDKAVLWKFYFSSGNAYGQSGWINYVSDNYV